MMSTIFCLVGAAGFEPATTRTPSVCATRLRHAPTRIHQRGPAPCWPRQSPSFNPCVQEMDHAEADEWLLSASAFLAAA